MKFGVRVEGLEHVNRALRQLSIQAQQRALARALSQAARPIRDAARSNAQKIAGSGALAMAVSTWRNRKGERARGTNTFASVEVGPRRSNKRALAAYYSFYKGRTPSPRQLQLGIRHGHLVEFGTKRTPARRWLTAAFDSQGTQAIERFRQVVGPAIEREARRLARQQGARR